MQKTAYETIPQPPAYPIIGHLSYLRPPHPVQNIMALAREYGPIYRLHIPDQKLVIISSQVLVNQVCDERRFHKNLGTSLRKLRPAFGDALSTAWTHEPNWQKAHNILLPNFSTKAMQGYLPAMLDVTRQLIQKWERLNVDDEVNVVDDMTRVTLDTIGLCGFNYRFNSFYRQDSHPFVASLLRVLTEAVNQLGRLPGQTALMAGVRAQFQADIAFMNAMVDKMIEERRASGAAGDRRDLLGYMLEGVDKQTGERLDDVNIRYETNTFLAAGHETTSGLLSFAIYFLLKNPHVLARAHDEMDRLLGGDLQVMPTYAQVNHFDYVAQILKETLRMWPTAPAFGLYPHEATTLAGKYKIDEDDVVSVSIPMLHRDPKVWGADRDVFDPDRFTPEREAALPPNAYKPFGNGVRACIGRQFAMQEATLVLGMILHRFELVDHNQYDLEIKETLTLKPTHFYIKVHPRQPRAEHVAAVSPEPARAALDNAPAQMVAQAHNTPLLVLFGSNMATAEGVANQIGEAAKALNFNVTTAALDDFAGKLPTEGGVLIVSSSYNGTPPDNAVKFCRWLRDEPASPHALQGVRYAVFGCGNRDWAGTYQAVPKLIDSRLEALGASRLYARGEGDGRDDFDGQFRDWYAPLWPAVAKEFSLDLAKAKGRSGPLFNVEEVPERAAAPFADAYGARPMTILENRELQRGVGDQPLERSTRHIEIALPEGVSYQAGDYLGVIPRHSEEHVRRVAARLNLSTEATVRIRSNGDEKTHLPVDQPIRVSELLSGYVELQEPATRTQIKALADHNECPPEKDKLLALSGSDAESAARYREAVFSPRKTLVDLLDEFPATQLPLSALLELVPPLKPRYYSISSSPRVDGGKCSLTVAVLSGPARSGRGAFQGVCSGYLSRLPAGSQVNAFVSNPNSPFHLPVDPNIPIILIGPGTGIAPMRGFLQERAALQAAGAKLGPALLFFGCRHPQQDYIYEEDLRDWAARGVVEVCTAFSRLPDQPKRYVQDELRAHGDEVWELIQGGAVVYICGDARSMAPGVRQAFADILLAKTGFTSALAVARLNDLVGAKRYITDVWAAS
jgi:cytochrome P450/NADPH-cytochrome P450 reductase